MRYRRKDKEEGGDRKRKYGVSTTQVNTMLDSQGFVCAICKKAPLSKAGTPTALHLDHCHTVGRIRAFLCAHCNRGLGSFCDDPNLLLAAARYLKKWRKKFVRTIPKQKGLHESY